MTTFLSAPFSDGWPRTADVIILGGGPAGTAALWALGRLSPTLRVVLVEQSDTLGAGSSGASLECYRSCWPSICLSRQLLRSINVFHNADEHLGEGAAKEIAVRQHGYLFCAFTEQQAAGLRADVDHLHEIGLPHLEFLTADDVQRRFPWVGQRVIAAKFDPMAGSVDSYSLIYRYARSATHATVLLGVADAHLQVEGGRVVGVATPHGTIAAPAVLIATGATCAPLAERIGVSLPVIVRPRQSFTTAWRDPDIPPTSPMIISAAPFPHFRPEAREGAIFGWEYAWKTKPLALLGGAQAANRERDALTAPYWPVERLKDPRFPSLTLALLARQFGHLPGQGFADDRYLRGIRHNVGYYVYRGEGAAYRLAPDGTRRAYESERAIIDAHPEVDGLFLSIAHAGHGIMSSPAAGEIAACRLLGLPFSDPVFADFGLDVPWVEWDESVL